MKARPAQPSAARLRIRRERRDDRRRLAHLGDAAHAERMLFLAQLAGRIEAADFSADELLEAEAALRQPPRARQASLALKGRR